jgi:hypothetical protein
MTSSKSLLWISLAVAGIATVFALVSLVNWLFPNHPVLVKRKLKTGALLLSLTAVVSSCGPGEATCYDVASPDSLNSKTDSTLLQSDSTIQTDTLGKLRDDVVLPGERNKNSPMCYGAPATFPDSSK